MREVGVGERCLQFSPFTSSGNGGVVSNEMDFCVIIFSKRFCTIGTKKGFPNVKRKLGEEIDK